MYCVIMAGGKGSRFWPRSRSALPKQLLDIFSDRTMLQETVQRIGGLIPTERIVIVTGREHAEAIYQQLPEIPRENILIEPIGRNTAPCICLAALWVEKKEPGATMAVLPADHYIGNPQAFCRCLDSAADAAQHLDALVTVGITPRSPETGYGYIQYLAQGNFLWNSGMFIWKAATILEEIKACLPEMYGTLAAVVPDLGTAQAQQAIDTAYHDIAGISIDYGVMEKSARAVILKGDFGWSDVGSWSAIYDISEKDAQENVMHGDVIAVDARGSLIYSPKKLTAIVGLDNVVIVETEDALLVCARDKAQDVKKVVDILEQQGRKKYL
ncbi:MAG: mannose-1-phosphate guanylyltransferase [Proteobacteria bacterium]|nr:mannose-1-phosphate guanylyltransferase [Pseudomonadota bacterium]